MQNLKQICLIALLFIMLSSCKDTSYNTFDFTGQSHVRITRVAYDKGYTYTQESCDTTFTYKGDVILTVDTTILNTEIDYTNTTSWSQRVYHNNAWHNGECYTEVTADSIYVYHIWILRNIKN